MKRAVLLVLSVLCLGFSAGKVYRLYFPSYFPEPVYAFDKNPLSDNKIQLGRALFYDPILSKDNKVSCASCHSPYNAFAHVDHDLSHGIDDQIGTRNAPALMNLAWQPSFMWDGAVNHLDMQALAPMSHPKEMGESVENVVAKLQRSPIYPKLFYAAFEDSIITGEHLLKAISQFELTLVSANSKYDSVQRKQSVFTDQEHNGYNLFQANCNSCHREPLFSTYQFANNGLPVDTTLNDKGRMTVSKSPQDSLKFKIPTLRNVAYSFPYMHDGRFKKLSQVVNHYTSAIQHNPTLSPELSKPVILSANEKIDLVAFLQTLSDRSFVFDSNYAYPKNILIY